jgi:hypothetical protein
MNEEQRQAQVVISADTSQYQQSVQAAAQQTNQLTAVVDKLSSSLDGLTKKAGNRLMIGSAAGLASFTAAAKVADNYKNSLSALNATATYTNLNVAKLNKGMSGIAQEWGVARTQVVGLAEAFTKLGQVTTDKKLTSMLNTGFKLGGATGEDVTSVSTALLELNRSMATANPEQYDKFAGALSKVSAESGSSATGVASFAQALAPIGKMAGITQNELLGISASFQQAGADGFYAANTFNSVVSDITRQIQYGSPEINKYASLLGMTREEFKNLGTTEGVVQLFEYIGKQGPDAVKILDDLGQDGIRAAKAITAVAQTGGLRKNIRAAESGYEDPSQMNEAAEEYYSSWSRSLTRVGEQFKEITVNFGQTFLPIAKVATDAFSVVLGVVEKITNVLDGVMGNPFGAFATSALVAAGAVGAILRSMKALSVLTGASFVAKSTPVQAFFAGRRDQGVAPGRILPASRNDTQTLLRERQAGPFATRWYEAGQASKGTWTVERAAAQAARQASGGPSLISRVAATPFRLGAWYGNATAQYAMDAGRDGVNRTRVFPANWMGEAASRFGSGRSVSQAIGGAKEVAKLAYRGAFDSAVAGGANEETTRKTAIRAATKALTQEMAATISAADAKVRETSTRLATLRANQASGAKVSKSDMDLAVANEARAKSELGAARAATMAANASIKAGGATALTGGRFGANLLGKGARGIGTGIESLAGMAGFTNPAVAAGVATVGVLGYAAYASNQEDKKIKDMANNPAYSINAYEAAIGKSTTSITKFSSSVDNASELISKNLADSIYSATRVSVADEIRAGKNEKVLGGANLESVSKETFNAEMAKSYLDSFGNIAPDSLSLVRDDLIKLIGADQASTVLDEYYKKNPDGQQFTTWDPNGLISGAEQENQRYRSPRLRNPFKSNSDAALSGMALTYGQIDSRRTEAAAKWGESAAGSSGAIDTLNVLGSVLAIQGSTSADKNSRMSGVKMLEERFGYDFNYNDGANKQYSGKASTAGYDMAIEQEKKDGKFLETLDSRAKAAFDAGSIKTGSDLKTFLTKQFEADQKEGVRLENESLIKQGGALAKVGQSETIQGFQAAPGDPGKANAASQELQSIMKSVQNPFQEWGRLINESTGPLRELAVAAQAAALKLAQTERSGTVSRADNARMTMREQVDSAIGSKDAAAGNQAVADYEAGERQVAIARIQRWKSFNTQREREQKQFDLQREQAAYDFSLSMERSEASFHRQSARSWATYYQSLRWQQQDYARSVMIATRDFNQQRAYADADYAKNKDRGVDDYELSRKRSIEDYQLSVKRAERDFNKSRLRAIEDFNKTAARMAEDGAKAMYDPYQRITTKMVWDTNNLIGNLEDQARAIEEQNRNLARLKSLGVSQDTIDQLGLADASNAQQTARITSDLENDPSKAQELNQASGQKQKAANDAIRSENNITYRRMEEDQKLSFQRSREDFAQSMSDSGADFRKGLARSNKDFLLSMARSDADKKTADQRANKQFKQSLADQNEQFEIGLARSRTLQNQSARYAREDHNRQMEQALADNKRFLDRQDRAWDTQRANALTDMNNAEREFIGSTADLQAQAAKEMSKAGSNMVNRIKQDSLKAVWEVQLAKVQLENMTRASEGRPGIEKIRNDRDPRGYMFWDTETGRTFHEGSIINRRIDNATIGEAGPEAIIPLNGRGADFMASTLDKVIQKMSVSGRGDGVSFRGGPETVIYDHSTEVSGPITVMSNDPTDMANQLAAKARRDRLTRR